MTLTKKHKIYLAVVGVGLCVVVLDRFVLDTDQASPAPAAAAAPATTAAPGAGAIGATIPSPPGPGALAARPTRPAVTDPATSLSARLDAVADATAVDPLNVRDAFKPDPSWTVIVPAGVGADDSGDGQSGAKPSEAVQFQQQHRLIAVIGNATGGGAAVVDGKPVVVGQRLGAFKLVAVNARSAVFESDNERAVLQLPAGGGSPGSK